jgi:hypothetical protein
MCGLPIRSLALSNDKELSEAFSQLSEDLRNLESRTKLDKLIEESTSSMGQPPSKIVVPFKTWEVFAAIATAETDPRIRWDRSRLMYLVHGGIRITWVR